MPVEVGADGSLAVLSVSRGTSIARLELTIVSPDLLMERRLGPYAPSYGGSNRADLAHESRTDDWLVLTPPHFSAVDDRGWTQQPWLTDELTDDWTRRFSDPIDPGHVLLSTRRTVWNDIGSNYRDESQHWIGALTSGAGGRSR